MDQKNAVRAYQFGERTKSELLVASQLIPLVAEMKEKELAGGKRVLLACLELFRTEASFAQKATGMQEFNRVVNHISEAISQLESEKFSEANRPIASAVSAATTAAQKGWQVLSEHGLL